MKRLVFFSLLLLYTLCAAAQEASFNTRVIPTPQQVVRTEGSYRAPAELKEHVVLHREALPGVPDRREAYRLVITPRKVHLYSAHDEGIRAGLTTLQMLGLLWEGNIPCMEITDWPAYEWRGFLDDVSRGPVPSPAFRDRQHRQLYEPFKLNFANYYTEHTLYNPDLPDVAPLTFNADMVGEDWLQMANLQCFAHFEKTLRIPFYQDIMDTRSNVDPSNEATYTFLQRQIENTLRAYPPTTPFFNINCDETEGLGSGRARHYVDETGADEAYCRHINRVYDMIQQCARRRNDTLPGRLPEVLMWGDIVGKNPAMLQRLPREMNYIVWSYVAQESYAGMIEPFYRLHQEQGTRFWVAPGVSHWSSIPQVRNYMQNIAFLARDGYKMGARGLMNTAWDDSGESLFGDVWHAMTWGAEMAWHPIESSDPARAREELAQRERLFNENYNRWCALVSGRPQALHTTQMIYQVADLAANPWVADWCNTGALMQPLLEFYPSNVDDAMLQRCDSVDHLLARLLPQLDSATVPHFYYAVHRIQCLSEKSRLRRLLYRGDAAAKPLSQQYLHHLHQLKREYLRLWDEECTDYSRDIILARYDQLGREVLELDRTVLIQADGDSIRLRTLLDPRPIYYTLDGRTPSDGSARYSGPIPLTRSTLLRAVSYNQWGEPVFSERYLLRHLGMGHLARLNSAYSTYRAPYSGGGDQALADGHLGSENSYADGHWQGYWGSDIDLQYDFGAPTPLQQITLRFLQNANDWILAPEHIELYSSADGESWQLVRSEAFHPDFRHGGSVVQTDALRDLHLTTRHLRLVVKNPGPLPDWHGSHGQPSYLFCDEVVIE